LESESETVVEGHSFGLLPRIWGLFCFLIINPLFLWIWIDDPKFWHGAIDSGVIFMAIVTLAMELLGVFGLLMFFARTRITHDAIEWGLVRRRHLRLEDIREIVSVFSFRQTTIVQLIDTDGKKYEITGGTPELRRVLSTL
jgi:hypothetical protein